MSVKFDFATLDKPFEAVWPVTVSVPQDGGTVELQTFNARLRLLSPAEIQALNVEDDVAALFKGFFIGLPGEDLPFEEIRDKMLTRQYVRSGLQDAYFRFQSGIPVKNSETSAGTGQPAGES